MLRWSFCHTFQGRTDSSKRDHYQEVHFLAISTCWWTHASNKTGASDWWCMMRHSGIAFAQMWAASPFLTQHRHSCISLHFYLRSLFTFCLSLSSPKLLDSHSPVGLQASQEARLFSHQTWPYKWVNGLMGAITPFATGRGPTLLILKHSFWSSFCFTNPATPQVSGVSVVVNEIFHPSEALLSPNCNRV